MDNQSNFVKPDCAANSYKPIKIVPENLPSQLLLKQSGIKDRKSLFQMIDSNFKDLPHLDRTSSVGRFRHVAAGPQINEAYANEANIQSQIFFYNNSVLNKVVDNLGLKGKRVENLLVRDESKIKNTLYPPANLVDIYSPPKSFQPLLYTGQTLPLQNLLRESHQSASRLPSGPRLESSDDAVVVES